MHFIPALLMSKTSAMIGAMMALFVIFVGVRNRNRFR
jgi:hypothetical protein